MLNGMRSSDTAPVLSLLEEKYLKCYCVDCDDVIDRF